MQLSWDFKRTKMKVNYLTIVRLHKIYQNINKELVLYIETFNNNLILEAVFFHEIIKDERSCNFHRVEGNSPLVTKWGQIFTFCLTQLSFLVFFLKIKHNLNQPTLK